jgi:aspartate/methionine/tyrosine aminotransferase
VRPPPSPTLATNERVQARIAAGAPVLHLAFGEAGLPVLPSVAERLGAAAGANGYGPVAGSPAVREAVAGYFERRGLPTSADRVLVAPGSKALLYALLTVLPGDVVLPRPSWVSYAAQAALAGKRVIDVPIAEEAGGVPDPDALRAALPRHIAARERLRHQRAEQEHGPRRLADRLLPAAGRAARRRSGVRAERDGQRGVVEPRRSDAARGRLRPR